MKPEREKENEVAKIVIKSLTFLFDPGVWGIIILAIKVNLPVF